MMKFLRLLFFITGISLTCCNKADKFTPQHNPESSSETFLKILQAHGDSLFMNSTIEFQVNNTNYLLTHNHNRRIIEMTQDFGSNNHRVFYDGGNIQYFINDSLYPKSGYNQEIINLKLDVFPYLFGIPNYLKNTDTKLRNIAPQEIRNKNYLSIKAVVYNGEHTPADHYILYINPENYIVEYLSIDHHQFDNFSFRRNTNFRRINGVLFSDFYAFSISRDSTVIYNLANKFNTTELKYLNKVEYKNITIKNN